MCGELLALKGRIVDAPAAHTSSQAAPGLLNQRLGGVQRLAGNGNEPGGFDHED
jgi:hypothetical protein